jgi:hypothetical protein
MGRLSHEVRLWLVLACALVTVFGAIGWLDVIRGRELAVVSAEHNRLFHELERVQDRLLQLERGRGDQKGR